MSDLLQVDELRVVFRTRDGLVRAVDGLSFGIGEGEAVGLVGESGCGKSVTSLSLLRLVESPPGEYLGGTITWRGRDLLRLDERALRRVRGREIAMIFQDPVGSLNPVLTVGDQIAEVAGQLRGLSRREAWNEAVQALRQVGIEGAEERARDYPHQLSGGMCQRVAIAAATVGHPQLLVADEPTTALDLTTQARILALLDSLRRERGMALLLVSHDLDVVADVVSRVVVMYAGRAVEVLDASGLFENGRHPYTRGLLASRPRMSGERPRRLAAIPGAAADREMDASSCAFHPRCEFAEPRCRAERPQLRDAGPAHRVACHRFEEIWT